MGWHEMVLQKKLEWEERILKRQQEVFFHWIETHAVLPVERVAVMSRYHEALLQFVAGEWVKVRPGQKKTPVPSMIRFVLCGTGMFLDGEKSFNIQRADFKTIFVSGTFEVWESVRFYSERGVALPLRLGLSNTEKSWVTAEVRRMMDEVLHGKTARLEAGSQFSLERLEERQDLDVAVWVGGRVRASVIMIGQTLREALEVGAKRATWDRRFAPLTKEELPEARIEITFMSDLIFPVLASDFVKNRIDAAKGYVVTLSGTEKKGWYLPEVHNVVSFSNLRDMLFRLATEKAGVTREEVKRCSFGQFTTFDWIELEAVQYQFGRETSKKVGMMSLYGPTEEVSPGYFSHQAARTMLDETVAWLCRIQEPDGNIPPKISQQGVLEKVSLTALGCTGHALAVYGQTFHVEQACLAAEKVWGYIKHALDSEPEKTTETQHYYTLVYFLRFSLFLKKEIDQSMIETLVRAHVSFQKNTILWLQTLSLLVDYEESGHTEYRSTLRDEVLMAQKVFEKKRECPREQLASYPELVAVCHGLWRLTGEQWWQDKAFQISLWYQGKQQENGAFPHSPRDTFVYTRGTGKIFEVLACFPEENKEILEKTWAWLRTMQYTQENTYFMSPKEQTLLVGGFRHDAFNREAWIDASAHVILGATRWLKR